MNLFNLVKNNKFSKRIGDVSAQVLTGSSTLSNLRGSVCKMQQYFNDSQEKYDAIGAAFVGVPEIIEQTASDIEDRITWDEFQESISISEESANNLASGFVQAMKKEEQNQIALVDELGSTYVIGLREGVVIPEDITDFDLAELDYVTDSGRFPMLRRVANGFTLNIKAKPTNYKVYEADVNITSALQGLYMYYYHQVSSKNLQDTLRDIVYKAHPEVSTETMTLHELSGYIVTGVVLTNTTIRGRIHQAYNQLVSTVITQTPLCFIAKSAITAGDINAIYAEIASAALSSKPGDNLNYIKDMAADKTQAVKFVVNRSLQSYNQGGYRGLVKFLIAFFEGGASISDDDGTMTFSNNSSLLPDEFIAGIVATVLSALAYLVSIVVAIFSKILGVLLTMLTSVASNIIKSVMSTHDDVYASVNSNFDSSTTSALPCQPAGFFQQTVYRNNRYLWDFCEQEYNVNSAICYVNVPGGMLFIGPGSFSDDLRVTSYRIEFHPVEYIYNYYSTEWNETLADCLPTKVPEQSFSQMGIYYVAGKRYLTFKGLEGRTGPQAVRSRVSTFWRTVCSSPKYYTLPSNGNNGHLSENDDWKLKVSTCISITLFYLWCTERYFSYALDRQILDGYAVFSLLNGSNPVAKKVLNQGLACISGWHNTVENISWSDIISLAGKGIDFDIEAFVTGPDDFADNVIDDPQGGSFCLAELYHCMLTSYDGDMLVADTPISIPEEFFYSIQYPQYNASTYWLWVALAATVTIAVATAAVVCAVKFSKFRKKKIAANRAKFDAAQVEYNQALNGTYTTVETDPVTGREYEQIHTFDPASSEGQERINAAWKSYKKQARTNNMWSHLIGGSRYDVTTFYGESEGETSGDNAISAIDKISSLLSGPSDTVVPGASSSTVLSADESSTNYLEQVFRRLVIGQSAA